MCGPLNAASHEGSLRDSVFERNTSHTIESIIHEIGTCHIYYKEKNEAYTSGHCAGLKELQLWSSEHMVSPNQVYSEREFCQANIEFQ